MRNFRLIILLLLLSSGLKGFSNPPHKFYVSVMEIRQKDKALQITFSVFWDDWSRYLEEKHQLRANLTAQDEDPMAESILKAYLKQVIAIDVNGKPVKLNYIGREYNVDLMYCYLEIDNIDAISKIAIENKFFLDYIDEQQNIVHVIFSKNRKSLLLDKDKPKGLLNFPAN